MWSQLKICVYFYPQMHLVFRIPSSFLFFEQKSEGCDFCDFVIFVIFVIHLWFICDLFVILVIFWDFCDHSSKYMCVLLSPNASCIPHSLFLFFGQKKERRDGASQNLKIMGLKHARIIVINLRVIPTPCFWMNAIF